MLIAKFAAGNYRVKMDYGYFIIFKWNNVWEAWKLAADSDLCFSVADWQKTYPESDFSFSRKTLRECIGCLENKRY